MPLETTAGSNRNFSKGGRAKLFAVNGRKDTAADNRGAGHAPGIVFDGVSFSFPGSEIFRDLNFAAEGGRCTCILGPSGCGKSTLLRLVSGAPDLAYEGDIRFDDGGGPDGRVAWMAQRDLLLPWMTLLDNVLLGQRLRGGVTDSHREKALSLINAVGLSGKEGHLPSALSGGMRQRAALLRTLMEERPVILMDEPFSALDALTRIRLQRLTSSMTYGATVLLVTHDPMEALRMGDAIHVMSGAPTAMGDAVVPPGKPPREAGDPELAKLNAELLAELLGETP